MEDSTALRPAPRPDAAFRAGGAHVAGAHVAGTHVVTARPAMAAGANGADGSDDDRGTSVLTRTKPKVKKPSLYRVLLLNDDYTPMEFVVHVLERFFQKNRDQAAQIMLHVHNHGVGECGVYTYEVAETKVTQVLDFAKQNHHPLQCVMEKK